jgi:hypothetical protein
MLDDLKAELAKARDAYEHAVWLIHKKQNARVAGNEELIKDATEFQNACDVLFKLEPIRPLMHPDDPRVKGAKSAKHEKT